LPSPYADVVTELDPEDAKLVTLARSAQTRGKAAEGAAVRDDMGRTYVAATVVLPSLALSALQAAVAAAVSSGSTKFEAVVVVGEATELAEDDRALLADVGNPAVHLVASDGTLRP
jgi:cytidine deaminase